MNKYSEESRVIKEALGYVIFFIVLGGIWLLTKEYYAYSDPRLEGLSEDLLIIDVLYLLISIFTIFVFSSNKIRKERKNFVELIETLKETNSIQNEKMLMETSLSAQMALMSKFISGIDLLVITWNENFEILDVNPFFLNKTGYTREEVIGKDLVDFLDVREKSSRKSLEKTIKSVYYQKIDKKHGINIIGKNYEVLELLTYNMPFKNNNDKIRAMITFAEDTTKENTMKKKLKYIAYYDENTGLPNKYGLKDYVNKKALEIERYKFSMFYIQIDSYKVRNEIYKNSDIDMLFQEISYIVLNTIGPSQFLAKVNEYEYIAIIEDYKNMREVEKIAKRLKDNLSKTIIMDRVETNLMFKIGIVEVTNINEGIDSLIQKAQFSIYNIKDDNSKSYEFFNKAIEKKISRENYIIKELDKAIENQEFIPYFQPIVDIHTGRIKGVETLVRWYHHEAGFISPGEFIPISEKTGQIFKITDIIIDKSFKQKQVWNEMGYKNLTMNVNISSKSINRGNIRFQLEDKLKEYKLQGQEIILEVTETASIEEENVEEALLLLHKFRGLGLSIALDDFGTGSSTLARLHVIPADFVKLDKGFIDNIEVSEAERKIAESIIKLAHNLNLGLIVEGIERKEQVRILKEMGCKWGQGYYMSKPVSGRDINKMLENDYQIEHMSKQV